MTSENLPAMTVAVQHWDRTAALVERRVTIPSVTITAVPNRVGWEGLFDGIFDAAELPVARFVFCHGQGDPLVALPIFPDRLFLQRYIYLPGDSAVTSLAELRGHRIAMPGYYFTASFWHRFFLAEAGVGAEEVDWISTAPELDARMSIPPGIRYRVQPSPGRGVPLLLDGDADCLMHEYTLAPPPGSSGTIRRLFPDTLETHRDWYRRTGVHPALHLMAVRREALERRPGLGVELCRAFDAAKAELYLWLANERTTGLPFAREAIDWSLEVLGDDPWSYGYERNANELNRFLDLAQADGLTQQRARLEDLFDPRSLEYRFQARM